MTYFVFCIHNHQPIGNFENVIEESYQKSYWPFLEALSRHPTIKLSLHNTGFLLDWMVRNHPEYIELLQPMVSAGQVEIMGGGYYEPVLSVLSEKDRYRQITSFSDRIEALFRVRPRGIWLAERVWEPTLPTTIKKAGLEYLVVDDYHFIKSGLKRQDLGGYYITEDQGDVIKIFPGSEALRYLIPFKTLDHLEGHLKGLNHFLKKGNAAIYGDDGEKFGSWPETYKWVFEEGWLENFFRTLEHNSEWLKPASLGDYMDNEEPIGQIYLPTTSYMEMGEWSLPAEASRDYTQLIDEVKHWEQGDRIRRFLQGGIWRNFFAKYHEANWMHKRMLHISRLIQNQTDSGRNDDIINNAEHALHKAQCNDAYWHGVFGGLYLPHLRTEVYKNLLTAENLAISDWEFKDDEPLFLDTDMDADNHKEVIMRTRDLNLFFSPRNGGHLFELDFKPKAVNLSNTLTRWYEGYHYKLEKRDTGESHIGAKSIHDIIKVKEEGLERYLKYDKVRRASFVDHIIGQNETIDNFYSNTYEELGDFQLGKYDWSIRDKALSLSRMGRVSGEEFFVNKEIRAVGSNAFKVDYVVKGPHKEGRYFGVELNLILPCCDGPACFYRSIPEMIDGSGIGLGSIGEMEDIKKLSLVDSHVGVVATIELDRGAKLWRFPVHTVSLSEGGFEKIYQGSCLTFLFPLEFDSEGSLKMSFKIRAESLVK
ncbi:MAG: DUF1926 domain-containing protein [Deltaproteobacteria bacterium]|nr:DUF1926 domain-containing protein [Deltaproteobacteria bacterium]